jgi:aclacinomycin oxidase
MTTHTTRRGLLTAAGMAGVAAGLGLPGAADAAPETGGFPGVSVRPADRRYQSLLRGDNWRFAGTPDEIRVVASTDQVVAAVRDAVRSGRRVAVRSGGHCFENFTADPAVRLLLEMSPMDAVGYDSRRRAFYVEPGARLGKVYTALFTGWGVTIPAGGCPDVGAGGHFAGGGYGALSRRYGSVVDHLYAVEVVVVDRSGEVRTVVATREPGDPNRDLWWAHTGGGGGNFGVVTRYWLRSAGATGSDPADLLPPAPARQLVGEVIWKWDGLTEAEFTTLLRNFGRWHEQHNTPGTPEAALYPIMLPLHRSSGGFPMILQMDADVPDAAGVMDRMVAAVLAGSGTTPAANARVTLPWLHEVTWPGSGEPGDVTTRRYKIKAGYLRKSFTDDQLAAIWRHLTNATGNPSGGMLIIGYGGQVDTVPPDATAVAQRDVIMKAVYQTIWADESGDAANLAWIREFYRDVYAATGGVPVPNDVSDGSYINYPDVDLADPAWNTSGVPWSTLYYKDNYPRLQRVKARWDPRNVFRHAMSVEPPA